MTGGMHILQCSGNHEDIINQSKDSFMQCMYFRYLSYLPSPESLGLSFILAKSSTEKNVFEAGVFQVRVFSLWKIAVWKLACLESSGKGPFLMFVKGHICCSLVNLRAEFLDPLQRLINKSICRRWRKAC